MGRASLHTLERGEIAHAERLDGVVPPHGCTDGARTHHIDPRSCDVQVVQPLVRLHSETRLRSAREAEGVKRGLQQVCQMQHGPFAPDGVVAQVEHLEVAVEFDGLAQEPARLVPKVIALQ
jgi:hypothetical protein